MSPRCAPALAAVLVAACASSQDRLDSAWQRFEHRQSECSARAESLLPEYTTRLRAQGDEEELYRITTPPGSPVAHLAAITSYASFAYLAADLSGLEHACEALARVERDLDALESRAAR